MSAPAPLATDWLVRARPDGPGEAYLPTRTVQSHAANPAVLPDGDLGCVWFGGTQEGVADISVWFSRLPAGTDRWSDPVPLSDDATRSEQNPVLFAAPTGELWLLHTAQHAGDQDTAVVRARVSPDSGRTWGPVRDLLSSPHGGIFVRQPPVVLPPTDRCQRLDDRRRRGGDPAGHRAIRTALRHQPRPARLRLPAARRPGVERGARHEQRVVLRRRRRQLAGGAGAGIDRTSPHEHRAAARREPHGVLPQPLGRPRVPKHLAGRDHLGTAAPHQPAEQQLLHPGGRVARRPDRRGLQRQQSPRRGRPAGLPLRRDRRTGNRR
ncbi:hypothetical protein FXF52_07470 [Micromonospora sp. MP36]|nr:hypothetical protein FXF52_07470 [Micromonospora sp. MP36]